jgi:Amt family ammonium transporter
MLGQLLTQLTGVVTVVAWSALAAVALAFLVEKTVGLRARDEHIEEGLDMAAHGERAYNP